MVFLLIWLNLWQTACNWLRSMNPSIGSKPLAMIAFGMRYIDSTTCMVEAVDDVVGDSWEDEGKESGDEEEEEEDEEEEEEEENEEV
jgi:hypothetical protein